MNRILALLALMALSGCTTAQIDQTKDLARQSIAVICGAYPISHAAFQAFAANRQLSATLIAREQQAVRALEAICASPPTDTATAIASASRVFAVLLASADQARKAGL